MKQEFPGNSQNLVGAKKAKPTKAEKPDKIEPVITGDVIQKKRGLGRKFKDLIQSADFKGTAHYVAMEVIRPAAKNMLADSGNRAIERMVYGESSRGRPINTRSRTTYNSPVNRRSAMLPDQPPHSPRPSVRPQASDIILTSRAEAELVLDALRESVDKYEVASVADLHSLVGLPSPYVDNNWGWYNLDYADVRQVRDGYLLEMPSPEPIQ